MAEKSYVLRYLPLFYEDLEGIITYIAEKLRNPEAAVALMDAVEKAVLDRVPMAEYFEKVNASKDRKYPYYRIYVKNYTVFYVVIDDEGSDKIMEVRRILYNGQDCAGMI